MLIKNKTYYTAKLLLPAFLLSFTNWQSLEIQAAKCNTKINMLWAAHTNSWWTRHQPGQGSGEDVKDFRTGDKHFLLSLPQSRASRGGSMEGGAAGKTSQESSVHSCDREAVTSEVGHWRAKECYRNSGRIWSRMMCRELLAAHSHSR